MHSTSSDGKLSPIELVNWAIKKKLPAIAITDHDNVGGIEECVIYTKDKDIEFIPGIELSCDAEKPSKEIHIVGLFIDYKHDNIKKYVEEQNKNTKEQKIKIIKKLNDLGYDITFEELKNEAQTKSYGRPHIARILIRKYPKEFQNIREVFDKLLGVGNPAYIKSLGNPKISEAINLIHSVNGIAVLAHPGGIGENAENIVDKFFKLGGDAIEVNYSYYKVNEEKEKEKLRNKFRAIAEKKQVLHSGGGDFHQHEGFPEIGDFGVTKEEFEKLKLHHLHKFTNLFKK